MIKPGSNENQGGGGGGEKKLFLVGGAGGGFPNDEQFVDNRWTLLDMPTLCILGRFLRKAAMIVNVEVTSSLCWESMCVVKRMRNLRQRS